MKKYIFKIALVMLAIGLVVDVCADALVPQSEQRNKIAAPPGGTITKLSDGRLLIVGGTLEGIPQQRASVVNPVTGEVQDLSATMSGARAWHTATVLPDASVLILGGKNENDVLIDAAERYDPTKGTIELIPNHGLLPRANHAATLMTDGRVLITGGQGSRGAVVSQAEIWDPQQGVSVPVSASLLTPRYGHTSVLQTSAPVKIEGGQDGQGERVASNEMFDPSREQFISAADAQSSDVAVSDDTPRVVASIPEDGARNVSIKSGIAMRFSKPLQSESYKSDSIALLERGRKVAASLVFAEEGRLGFIRPAVELVPETEYSVLIGGLLDKDGKVLPLSSFGFTTEALGQTRVNPSSTANATGVPLPVAGDSKALTKKSDSKAAPMPSEITGLDANSQATDADEFWMPSKENYQGKWLAKRPATQHQYASPLTAAPGTTALSGQVLLLNGRPLANVTLSIAGHSATTDEKGRFLLIGVASGRNLLVANGHTADKANKKYGQFEIKVHIEAGKTNKLPYIIWMPRLDTQHEITIQSPTKVETVLTTPYIPGLEVHLPAGVVIRDREGKIVTQLGITPIPVDRPPFPIPPDSQVPIYFTIQPGGATLQGIDARSFAGARIVYPNYLGQRPGAQINFLNYDPVELGWHIYGQGRVQQDGRQVVPDPGVAIYQFSGAMIANDPPPQVAPPANCCSCKEGKVGDPVDCASGLFEYTKRDLYIDDLIPIDLTRTFTSLDTASRAYGRGFTHQYNIRLTSSLNYKNADLVLPNGSSVHFVRISPGTGYTDAVYEHTTSPSIYYKARISYTSGGLWEMKLTNGTSYFFPEYSPVQEIRDRNGNRLTIERSGSNITRIVTPSGRWAAFTYDTANRITQVQDNIGRTATYSYDAQGRLSDVVDIGGGTEHFTYDGVSNRIVTINDARNNLVVRNEYMQGTYYTCSGTALGVEDSEGVSCGSGGSGQGSSVPSTPRPVTTDRVYRQTFADGSSITYSYYVCCNIQQNEFSVAQGSDQMDFLIGTRYFQKIDITDGRGYIDRMIFNFAGFMTSNTHALGQPEAQTLSYVRDPVSNKVMSTTDALNRTTVYTYDGNGNRISVTRMSGTSQATTRTTEFDPVLNLPTKRTDELQHSTNLIYDSKGNLTTITDPLLEANSINYDSRGLPIAVRDAMGQTTSLSYEGPDLSQITDALGHPTSYFADSIGRITSTTNPQGLTRQAEFNAQGHLTKKIDPLGRATNISYDGNGNLTGVTDANGGQVTFQFDAQNYPNVLGDALQVMESRLYDNNHNLARITDRKGQITQFAYDGLNRLKQVTYHDSSTVAYTYDAGDRITQVADSLNGNITFTYDDYDRLLSTTTSKGTVSYTYFANDLRKTMSVSGQPTLHYYYDDADRLTRIHQDAGVINGSVPQEVQIAYNLLGKRQTITLPNASSINYSYDEVGQVTSILYKAADGTQVGDLNYTYDEGGNRTGVGGSFARISLPGTAAAGPINAANRLSTQGGTSYAYDANGNMTSDGGNNYHWNARNELVQITNSNGTPIAEFKYDGLGRREAKTIYGVGVGYVYDGANVIQRLNAVNVDNSQLTNIQANYLVGLELDDVFAAQLPATGGQTNSFLTDAIGSVVRVVDASGAKLADFTYSPYGTTTADAAIEKQYQYTGREMDETGLIYMRARYYSPALGRFISEDPVGLDGGANFYAYVEGDPISFTDREGLQAEHTSNARPSTLNKHQEGQSRRGRDAGGERGDGERRPGRKAPPGHKGPWPPKNIGPKNKGFFVPAPLLRMCVSPIAVGILLMSIPSTSIACGELPENCAKRKAAEEAEGE